MYGRTGFFLFIVSMLIVAAGLFVGSVLETAWNIFIAEPNGLPILNVWEAWGLVGAIMIVMFLRRQKRCGQ